MKVEHYTQNQEVRLIQLNNIGDGFWKNDVKKYTTFQHANELLRCKTLPEDLVIAKMMPAGRCTIIPNIEKQYIISSDCVKLTPDIKLNLKYLVNMINSPTIRKNIQDNTQGIGRSRTSLGKLKELFVPIPPIPEQKRIAETVENLLGIVDTIESDKIDLSELIKQTKSKVLDLAIRGKLVPQNPNDEPADKLLEKIREEREKLIKKGKLKRDKNGTFIYKNNDDNSYYEQIDGETVCIDDDLPFEIPDSWRWCKLRNIYNICSSKRVLQSEWKTQGVPFYRAREIVKLSQQGFVENELFISNEHYENLKANYGTPTEGDIMVSGVGTIGKAYVVKSSDKFYYKDASVLCFKRYSKFINSDLFKYLIESYFMQKQLNANSNGTTVDTITISSAGDYLYPLVPCKEQDRILLKVKNIFSYLDNLESIIKGS